MLELFKGNSSFTEIFMINPVPIPNLTGYFFLAGLLIFFSAATTTKLIVTLTFAAFVAAAGWLRFQTVGRQDLELSLLFGAVLAFNWMWFLGFYNFIIGVVGFIFSIGLYWKWRENLNFRRAFVLSLLFIFVFFSHLVSFGMLGASIFLVSIFVPRTNLKQIIRWIPAAFLPVLPFFIGYKLLSETSGGEFSPVWQGLANPFSLSNWVFQFQLADPFLLLSRKTFPFIETDSILFALFSPMLWFAVSIFCLLLGAFVKFKKSFLPKKYLPFLLLFVLSILFWMFSPDDFGKAHGAFLRERVLLCGLVCFIPLFDSEVSLFYKNAARICLLFVILFQTAVLWDYALRTNKLGREYLVAEQMIKNSDSLGSILMIESGCRYKSNPLVSINPLLGIGKETRIWDNYEIGYYLFPVVAQNPEDRRFVFEFSQVNAINLCNPIEIDKKFSNLESLLNQHHQKFNVMLVWNGDQRVSKLLSNWFEDECYFQNGKVRLYRHR